MLNHHLETYLNDHLGGSAAALEMLPHLAEQHADIVDAHLLEVLRVDIARDRETLESIMQRLGADQSRLRKAAGWIAERFARLKLAADDPGNGPFRAFEMVELISLGVEGKNALWKSLAAIAPTNPVLGGIKFDELLQRGREQRAILQPIHDDLARRAFTPQ